MKVSKKKYKEGGKVGPTDPRKKYSQHPADTAPNSPENKREKEAKKQKTRSTAMGPMLNWMTDDKPITLGSVRHWKNQAEQEMSKKLQKLKNTEYGTTEYYQTRGSINTIGDGINEANRIAAKLEKEKKYKYKKGGMIKVNKKKC